MTKIEFGFGVGIDADGKAVLADRKRVGIGEIRDMAVSLFGGCTLTQTTGDWWDKETDTLYCEDGITLFVLVESNKPVEARVFQLAEQIKHALNQKAVYVTRYEVDSKLY